MNLECSVECYVKNLVVNHCAGVIVNCYYDRANGFLMSKSTKYLKTYNMFYAKKDLTKAVMLTIRHEIGHVIFDEMLDWSEDGNDIKKMFQKIKKRKWFCRIQRVWYWNKFIRWIKRKCGFSTKLWYKKNDKYRSTEYIMSEVELFADWFAVYGWKE